MKYQLVNTITNEVLDSGVSKIILVENYLCYIEVSRCYFKNLSHLINAFGNKYVIPFNTLGELVQHFPDILNYSNEIEIFYNIDSCMFVPMGYANDYPIEIWNKILETVNRDIRLIEIEEFNT